MDNLTYTAGRNDREHIDISKCGARNPRGCVEGFPSFDPHKNIAVGQFVAVLSLVEERRLDAIFYVGKVRALERAATPMV